jgi:OCT family organic cation transporter-like MFS transporter 4/5
MKKSDADREVGDVDAVLKQIGSLGKFQIRTAILLWLTTGAAGIAVVVFAFTAFEPDHRCVVPQCESPNASYYANPDSKTFADHLTRAFGGRSDIVAATSGCKKYTFDDDEPEAGEDSCESYLRKLNSSETSRKVTRCGSDELIFDDSVVKTSLVIDFGFTCQWRFLRSVYNAIYLGGMLAGSFVFGLLSDRFGRMRALMLAVAMVSASGTISAFVTIPAVFGVLRFFTGMGGMGCYIVVSRTTEIDLLCQIMMVKSWRLVSFGAAKQASNPDGDKILQPVIRITYS